MLMMLSLGWPWILIGIVLLIIGVISVDLPPKAWLEYLMGLPFLLSSDQTQEEKEQTDQPLEEVAAANPGCMLMAAGIVCIGYGLFRWLA